MVVKRGEFVIRNDVVVLRFVGVGFWELGIVVVDLVIVLFDRVRDRMRVWGGVDWGGVVCGGNE